MKKRWIALLLSLALLLGMALPATALAEALPDCYTTESVLSSYNYQMAQVFMKQYGTQAATMLAKYRTMGTQMGSDGMTFANSDGQVVLRVAFGGGQGDPSAPADEVSLTIARTVNSIDLAAIKTSFACMIADLDSSANRQAVQDWMSASTKGGESLSMNGYALTHERDGSGDVFSLAVAGAGAVEPEPPQVSEPKATRAPLPKPSRAPAAEPTQAPAPEPTQAPTVKPVQAPASGGAMLSWNGFQVFPLRYEIRRYSDGDSSMKLYVTAVNNGDVSYSMAVESVEIGGRTMTSTGLYNIQPGMEIGADASEYLLIKPKDGPADADAKAIFNATSVTLTLELKELENYTVILRQPVTVDLTGLECDRHDYMASSNSTAKPKATPKPTAKPKATSKPYYTPLYQGDKGEDVRRMQKRLIELGYLSGGADGSFGPKTATAVRSFRETNGLGSGTAATSEMQALLYSNDAWPYQEPWVPLIIEEGARGEWQKSKNNRLAFRVKVTNSSQTRTVKGFELYLYATDVWGDRLYSGTTYYGTTTKNIKPGKSAFSDYFLLPERSEISKIWCGIKKVIFTDGTVRENDTVNYLSWQYSG